MSLATGGWRRRPLRRELSTTQLLRVQQLRAARQGSRWWRPTGGLLIALALLAALDPDYPLPRSLPTAASAERAARLRSANPPIAVMPRGAVDSSSVHFRWSGPVGADFEFVLLDEQLDEIYRRHVRGNVLPVDAALRGVLLRQGAGGRLLHWFVAALGEPRPVAGLPVAFEISR